MHRRRRANNDATIAPHHPSAHEIDEEPNMEQDAAYYDDRQSPDFHADNEHHDDLQRPHASHYPATHQEQEKRRAGGRGGERGADTAGGRDRHWPAAGPTYSGARVQSQSHTHNQQRQHSPGQQQTRTTLEVHVRHNVPPGEDTEELTEPLLQQASPSKPSPTRGSVSEQPKSTTDEHQHRPATVPAPATALASKLSPSSSISSSSLSSKASKASKTSSKHRLRKSRSKDAQTEIEHPKAPLVVAEDSEDLDGDDDDQESERDSRANVSPRGSNNGDVTNENYGEPDGSADGRTLKSSSSSRSTMAPRGR